VAETSVTVPGVHYVIDAGTVRLSRYSYRSKVQRLPIEPISQASANQRAGRCGRIAPGVCIRLYSLEDFQSRPLYTDPEILRTNLAGVILKMATMNLGRFEDFPFITSPDLRFVKDGYRLLHEIGAMDERGNLQASGRILAKFSLEPRLAKMLLTAKDQKVLREMLMITSFLSIQDIRERPVGFQPSADKAHRSFWLGASDFLSLVNLFEEAKSRHSNTERRKFCKENFLSFIRLQEWIDLHHQLSEQVTRLGWKIEAGERKIMDLKDPFLRNFFRF